MPDMLFVVNDPAFFLSHRLALARGAQAEGFEVAVAAPDRGLSAVDQAGFTTHAIDLERGSLDPWKEARTRRSLTRLYRDVRPDLVHHVTIKPVVHGGIAASAAKVPAVVNAITGLGWVFLGTGPKAALARAVVSRGYRRSLAHPNHITIFQNRDDQALFVDRGLARREQTTIVLGSGIDPDQWPFLRRPDGVPLVVFPGRLLWDKGVGTFVEAARLFRAEGGRARFALVGETDADNRSSVPERTVAQWEDDGIVEVWGHRSDMHDVYQQASIVCLPSRREGVPRALLEAAASGCPIVTTDAPGCREIVDDGRNGLLVPVDDPQALARALRTLVGDPLLCARMGRAAREKVNEGFTEKQVVQATLEVYRTVLRRVPA